MVGQRQFWLGPARAGQTVRFWASVDVIHLTIGGARVKSLRSHFSAADLAELQPPGRDAGRARRRCRPSTTTAAASRSTARSTTAASSAWPASRSSPPRSSAARPVIVRVEPQTLMFLDPETRELLRVRPNPLTPEQALRLQGARPAGPPPRPRTEPVTVQRRVSANGRITVCRQTVALGRVHAGRIVTVHVSVRQAGFDGDLDAQGSVRAERKHPF